jgi:hypothetical protein
VLTAQHELSDSQAVLVDQQVHAVLLQMTNSWIDAFLSSVQSILYLPLGTNIDLAILDVVLQ